MNEFGIYMIGSITSSWNGIEFVVEQYLHMLTWQSGASNEIVEALGNDTRTEILFKLILAHEHRKDFITLCDHTRKHLLICRDNRNFISHGIVHTRKETHIELERFTKKRSSRLIYKIPYEELVRVSEDAVAAFAYINYITQNSAVVRKTLGQKRRGPLPQIRALPRRISESRLPTRKVR